MNIYLSLIVSLGALLTLGANAQASDQGVQDHASIRDAARQHIAASADDVFTARAEVSVGRLDSRLKLTACDQTLETYDSPNGLNGGRGVVGVRCNGSKPWKIFVPVNVALMESVVRKRSPTASSKSARPICHSTC